tara:strand:- start:2410 stop:3054 length:645 start_codon:yes stop_codon:yes gene_type:complete
MSDYFKKYGDSSGGTLNDICEAFRLATRKNSISVISLQQKHKIISPDHLLAEIDRHHHEDCECGLKSATTMEQLAQKLYDAQDTEQGKAILERKGEQKWDLDTCRRWMGNLMGKNSFKGKKMEDKAIKDLKVHIWKYKVEKADEETDVAHMVDLVIKQNDEIKAGIQVKPDSFYHMKLPYVQKLHDELDYPVHHMIYDSKGEWTNYLATISHFL